MKSWVLEYVIAENQVLFAFLLVRVISFSGKKMIAFPQSIFSVIGCKERHF